MDSDPQYTTQSRSRPLPRNFQRSRLIAACGRAIDRTGRTGSSPLGIRRRRQITSDRYDVGAMAN